MGINPDQNWIETRYLAYVTAAEILNFGCNFQFVILPHGSLRKYNYFQLAHLSLHGA